MQLVQRDGESVERNVSSVGSLSKRMQALDAPPTSPTALAPPAVSDVPGATAPAGAGEPGVGLDSVLVEALAGVVGGEPTILPETGEAIDVWLTIYSCPPYCGLMANGEPVYDGAAACGYGLALGQRFRIENDPTLRDYVCSDRGLGPQYWVDIFFRDPGAGWDFLAQVGTQGRIVLLP